LLSLSSFFAYRPSTVVGLRSSSVNVSNHRSPPSVVGLLKQPLSVFIGSRRSAYSIYVSTFGHFYRSSVALKQARFFIGRSRSHSASSVFRYTLHIPYLQFGPLSVSLETSLRLVSFFCISRRVLINSPSRIFFVCLLALASSHSHQRIAPWLSQNKLVGKEKGKIEEKSESSL
jgi:hypothetical protein